MLFSFADNGELFAKKEARLLTPRGEIGIPIRIARDYPTLIVLQRLDEIAGRNCGTAGLTFVVDKFGERIQDDAEAAIMGAKTDFDIAATEDEVLIEATNLIEDCVTHGHAGASNCEKVAIPTSATGETECEGGAIGERMIGEAIHAEDDTGVLDGSVSTQKFSSDDADSWEVRP